ncbi:nicotinate-nucleotide adenylyltransferase [bacterium]|nr:nicotinate-nucleotide adenylyltransferase [bacterium]
MDNLGNRIGIIGGTFDPIHNGHLIIAEKARDEFSLEKVVFIPAGNPPHKKTFFASAEQRYEMVKTAVKNNPFFEVSTIELDKKRISYTYETVLQLEQQYLNSQLYLIIGEDSFLDLASWHKYELLAKKVVFLVARRDLVEKSVKPPLDIEMLNYYFISSPLVEISSSYIRDCIYFEKTVKYLIPDKVFEYIRRNNLYGFNNT